MFIVMNETCLHTQDIYKLVDIMMCYREKLCSLILIHVLTDKNNGINTELLQ